MLCVARRRPFLIRGLENTLAKLMLSLEFFDEVGRKKLGMGKDRGGIQTGRVGGSRAGGSLMRLTLADGRRATAVVLVGCKRAAPKQQWIEKGTRTSVKKYHKIS